MDQDQEKRMLHNHILDIFCEIIDVCDRLNITYFIMGGTALGAVRHGGFIPWDDDLDIGMLRSDYNRFLKEAPEYLRKDLFLQTFESEKRSPFYFAKVRKNHTEFIEGYCKSLPIHSGIYVDIFPYDSIPDAQKVRRRYYRKMKFILNLYIAKSLTGTSVTYTGLKKVVFNGIRWLLHILLMPVPKSVLFHILDRGLQQYNLYRTTYVGYGGLPKIQIKREDVENTDIILFEGLLVGCPGHIENYLRDNFGDYMQLPPESKREGHAPYKMHV